MGETDAVIVCPGNIEKNREAEGMDTHLEGARCVPFVDAGDFAQNAIHVAAGKVVAKNIKADTSIGLGELLDGG